MKKKESNSANQIHTSLNHPVFHQKLTLGQKAADILTKYCGSWIFIILVFAIIIAWITLNMVAIFYHWDPWPFILLNLVLSCIAAIQAPIILMSENRQAERDRINARYDYIVNRKAEREIEKVLEELKEIKTSLRNKKN